MGADDDDFDVKPVVAIVNAWDDEEEDTGAPATESWEDFDKPKEQPKVPSAPAEKKTFTQVSGKKKRGKALAEKIRQKEAEEEEEAPRKALTYEEKKRMQEQVEASDLENAKDVFAVKNSALKDSDILFGNDSDEAEKKETTLDNFKPKTEKDFIKLAELVNKKVVDYSVRRPAALELLPT